MTARSWNLDTAAGGTAAFAAAARRRAAFLDKDGTLLRDVPHNIDPKQVEFTPGAFRGLERLADAGFLLVVVSNEPGLELGYFTRAAFELLAHHLTERLADAGIVLAGVYACPHRPPLPGEARCDCRKPAPGLLHRAAYEHNIDLAGSWMIGDHLDDIEAGRRAGCRTVLLDVGSETEWRLDPMRTPHLRAPDLAQAARTLLAADAAVHA